MARTGLYKSDVKKARDVLIAQNKHPSVDAVRVELGHTGSKTTIHKYLREVEAEEGGAGAPKASVSEVLQNMVARMAAQLQDEASLRIDALQTASAENERQYLAARTAMQAQIEAQAAQLTKAEATVQHEAAAHVHTRELLQKEAIARHRAEQQATGLKERLAENEAHRASLEEKHQHAREALEHYRQSVKEQRDQDQRRQEQQVQQLQAEMRLLQQSLVVKQEDVTRLNQEGARLVGDLSHTQKALHDEQSRSHQLVQRLEQLLAAEQRCKALERDVADKDALARDLKGRLEQATQRAAASDEKAHALELALTAAQAKVEAQQVLGAELRAYMSADKKARKASSSKDSAGSALEGQT